MKRVLLLGFGKTDHMPYMNLYIDTFQNSEIDLVCWERDGQASAAVPKGVSRVHVFSEPMENTLPLHKKLTHFQHYRHFVCQLLRRQRYDLMIVMQAAPGLILLDKLLIGYRGKYLLDFRDLSYEHIPIYRAATRSLAKGARAVFVSSNAFRQYLPQNIPIYTVHNYLEESLEYPPREIDTSRKPIRICFWGFPRGIETNRRLMDAIGNDDRFELHYFGRKGAEGSAMEQYAAALRYRNIFFHGAYVPSERYAFIAQTDIIHNAFDLNRTMKYAVSNKYYDGLIFAIPQLCTKGSYMGELVTEQGVGLAIDLSRDDIASQIITYYTSISAGPFRQCCKNRMAQVQTEQEAVKQLLKVLEADSKMQVK